MTFRITLLPKIPINEATVNERAKDMADKEMAAQKEELMSNTTTGDGDNHEVIHQKVWMDVVNG